MSYLRAAAFALLFALAACGGGKSPKPPYPGIKIGKPYEVYGRWYEPKYNPHYDEIGVASWYGPGFHGGHTANGESYDQNAMTAAHRTLPMPSIVRVTNLDTGDSALVKINDRGPFAHDRIIDLSRAAAVKLGVWRTGTARVRVQFLEKETRDYVQNVLGGTPYAMSELKTVDPEEAGEREEQGAKPSFRVEGKMFGATQVPGGNTPPPQVESRALPPPRGEIPGGGDEFAVVEPAPETLPSAVMPAYGASAAGGYTLQFGTFSQHANAVSLADRLDEVCTARITPVQIGGRKFYRVTAGPYRAREDAKNMLSKLSSLGISDAAIVRN